MKPFGENSTAGAGKRRKSTTRKFIGTTEVTANRSKRDTPQRDMTKSVRGEVTAKAIRNRAKAAEHKRQAGGPAAPRETPISFAASPHIAAAGATQPKPLSYGQQPTPIFANPKNRKTPWNKL